MNLDAKNKIIIAGAGLSGLATASVLPQNSFMLFESEAEPGGLCRSIRHEGYTFDYTGHLLHLKGEMLEWVEKLMPNNLIVQKRRAYVFSHGRMIDYPFQLHFGQLPNGVRDECLCGFEEIQDSKIDITNFATWSETTFGKGITKYFMRPYNEKLFRTKLEELSADAVQYIPRPNLEEVRQGALGKRMTHVGYNAEFRYPAEGGIGVLPQALSREIKIITSAKIEKIIADEKKISVGKEWFSYSSLVSTIPLPELIKSIADAPSEISSAASSLEAVGVLCLNLGIEGKTSSAHWIYFPEQEFPFYRVGFYHNIAPYSAPPGKSSLYVEISYKKRTDLPKEIVEQAIEKLVSAGIIKDEKKVEVRQKLWIDNAYAIHNSIRKQALDTILPFLKSKDIIPIGRFGRWTYTSMGEALLEGREIGIKLSNSIST